MIDGIERIRNLNKTEQRLLLSWAEKEGWNPGLHDADSFWRVDPDGFLGIEIGGVIAGGGAIIKHNPGFGFMGLFIMRPEFRSKKLGTKLWYARRDHLLSRLKTGATIGLDAVDTMVPFYARGGFVPYTRQVRYEWSSIAASNYISDAIITLENFNFDILQKYDRDCFPGPRSEYLRLWIQQPDAHAFGLEKRGKLRGFGAMRPCVSGWKIGPLFADSRADAQELLMAFGQQAKGESMYMDAPESNPEANYLCRSLGMREVFGCVRMYRGAIPNLADHKIYSITNFEIG
jgi:GNAT superfamily N-acetyltransferase